MLENKGMFNDDGHVEYKMNRPKKYTTGGYLNERCQ
ncbi:hypothetical protein SS7213T_04515 [Staphylococcus simiae CCM 7213 = CCUG 51256]|uniref:Uncharacterized protein n=1 Tax=Staphylococcus simiae CCM 7213 = CCUG 51256 TaxID=911238 RepID=G5JHH4_9STAP|nr:hypothetical protein SS7213T_04515 [Staphylococcus simiae CCM 7213 = CCUG 51256]